MMPNQALESFTGVTIYTAIVAVMARIPTTSMKACAVREYVWPLMIEELDGVPLLATQRDGSAKQE